MPHQNSGMYLAGSQAGTTASNAGWNVLVYKSRTVSAYPQYTYASWYQRSDDNWTFCGDNNYKVWDYSAASDPYASPNNWYIEYNPRPTSTTSIPAWHLNDDSTVSLQTPDTNGHTWWWANAVNPMAGKWTKVEVEIRYAPDTSGYIHVWENGNAVVNYGGRTDGFGGSSTRSEAIGGYGRCYGYDTNWRYFSDLYLDYSRARVMLANSADYTTATIIEPQLVNSWADGNIAVTVNRGTIPAGQTAYLFVVTDSGVRSTPGVAVGTTGPPPVQPDPPSDVTVR